MQRRFLHLLAAGFAAGSFLVPAIASPPLPITTAPIISGSATTRPAPLTVLLTPFKSISDSSNSDWISQAIEEELASDLNRNPSVRVVRSPTTGPSIDGLNEARQASAQRLVIGTYQTVDDQVRINGEVIDPSDGKSVGHLKVTGTKRDLFKLEDMLAAELLHVLPGVDEPDQSFTVTPVPSEGMMTQAGGQQPVFIQNGPGYVAAGDAAASDPYAGVVYPTNPDIGYGGYGDYPGYGYGYPYFDSPFFVYVRGGHRFRHRGGSNFGNDGFNHFHGGLTGGGPIVPTERVPTERVPTFPNGEPRSPGPASVTPSHGFVGPTGPGAEAHGGGGGRR